MNLATFDNWLAKWGEERLAQVINDGQRSSVAVWERRNQKGILYSRPAWELRLSPYWQEDTEEWHARWAQCGGRLYEGRMIAAKWDGIWEKLSGTFCDGLGKPYPPYARSSCACWREVDQDEAIVLGVISEDEFNSRMEAFPKEPHLDRNGNPISKELLENILKELQEDIYRHGGPRPGASREERVAHKRQQLREQSERMEAEYERRNQQASEDRAEKNAMFRLLEEVERSIRENPIVRDDMRWNWICDSLAKLTTTKYFEQYPKWTARAWEASATMYGSISMPTDELACLKRALELNPQLAVKRRIKSLDRIVNGPQPSNPL